MLSGRDLQEVLPGAIHGDEWLLSDHRRRPHGDRAGVAGALTAVGGWSPRAADEDHVPHAALHTLGQARVAGAELLLAAGLDRATDLHVSQEAPTGVTHADPIDVLGQGQILVCDDAAQRRCLRHGPQHVRAVPEVLRATPEGAQRTSHVGLVALLAVDPPGRIEHDVLRAASETEDLRVVPDGDINMVRSRLEEEGEARWRELAVVIGLGSTVG
mmetsp:Transcript_11300/g.28357  ORF Transcript_11300/g.28357 Transcript_11300/m.28357 type:complete len:215 (-) Transcript_11300:229-873(-)